MRSFLGEVQACGELVSIAQGFDPTQFDLAACLSALDGGAVLRFTNTGATGMAIVGHLLATLERIALGLGCGRADITSRIAAAIARPLVPRLLEQGPAQEVSAGADLRRLPIPRFFEHETGPYLTAGCIVTQDRASGQRNLSYARVKPLGPDRALVGIAPNHHLAVMARAAQARGETLPVAITLGNHPAVLMAAALYLKLGDDELEVAGALAGAPIPVLRCRSSELLVPAHCEIVIEGELDLAQTVEEGPVSEYHGMYERYGVGCVLTVKAITHRRDAMLQVVLPGYHQEHVLIGAVSIAASLQSQLRAFIPAVGTVAVPASACGRLAAVVTLGAQQRDGDAKKAILGALSAVNLIKQVTVVDDDIDPWDETAVQWAVATRMRAERDLVVVPGMRTDRSEPLKLGGTVTKFGLDATRRSDSRDDWTRALPPQEAFDRVASLVAAIRQQRTSTR